MKHMINAIKDRIEIQIKEMPFDQLEILVFM